MIDSLRIMPDLSVSASRKNMGQGDRKRQSVMSTFGPISHQTVSESMREQVIARGKGLFFL